MKFLKVLLAILFFNLIIIQFVQAAVCRSVPANGTGRQAQRVQRVNSILPLNVNYTGGDNFGRNQRLEEGLEVDEDIIYEGPPCPTGMVCLETLFNTVAGRSGQVVVIDKQTGLVTELRPIRSTNNSSDGMPFLNPRRLALYRSLSSGFYGGVPNSIDFDSYQASPVTTAEREAIRQALNDGFLTKPGNASQTGSIKDNYAGTLSQFMGIVGTVRSALGCEPETVFPNGRLINALNRTSTQQLRGCEIDYRNGRIQSTVRGRSDSFTLGGINEEWATPSITIPSTRRDANNLCTSRIEGSGLEVFSCTQFGATHTFTLTNGEVTRIEASGERSASRVTKVNRRRANDIERIRVPYSKTCDITPPAPEGGGSDAPSGGSGGTTTNTNGGSGGGSGTPVNSTR